MGPATSSWPHTETDPQRQALLAAADRLLAGTPRHSTGRLSVVQLAVEAEVKYWIVAQKHTDLRDHFQKLTSEAGNTTPEPHPVDPHTQLQQEHDKLRQHCHGLEQLVALYATAINELTVEKPGATGSSHRPPSDSHPTRSDPSQRPDPLLMRAAIQRAGHRLCRGGACRIP